MSKIAFVFSGQGAQCSGMGQSLVTFSQPAAEVFSMAEDLMPGVSELCFAGTDEELRQTKAAQPAIFCVSLAAARSLEKMGVRPDMLAGFSIGEITALAFAGTFKDSDGFSIVLKRGDLMQKAGQQSPSSMMAVLKLDAGQVAAICKDFSQVYPVNYNSQYQTVVAGAVGEMDALKAAVKEAGGRALPLAVSGGFHSPFMEQAADEFSALLANQHMELPQIPVYSNVTALPYEDDVLSTLSRQMTSPVLWQKTIENMAADGAAVFVEVGPGRTLCNLIEKTLQDVRCFAVEDNDSLVKAVEELSGC